VQTPIRLIIADDHALFRQGLKSLLQLQPDIEVVAEVERATELRTTLSNTYCDVLLLDMQMDRWLMDDIPDLAKLTTVIVLTASESGESGVQAVRLGARAVVHKRFAIETLMTAIHTVRGGLVWMPPTVQAEFAAQGSSTAKRLTARELEVVRFVAVGLRNAEVAERLSITESTVKTHLNNIFEKLELRDRVELVIYALRNGLVAAQDGATAQSARKPEK
jgi:DNA-binding NarL/FixJ family response regulator